MVLTDQYMQKMETELTEVRQCVVKMEAAMQKWVNNSKETAKASPKKKEGNDNKDSKNSKDNKSSGDFITTLKKLSEQNDKIGSDIGKAATNAVSKIGDAFSNYLKTGKMDWSGVVNSLKTDARSIATKEATSLLASGLLKWLGVNDTKSVAKPGEKQENSLLATIQNGMTKFFDQVKKDFGQFFEDGKTVLGQLFNFISGSGKTDSVIGNNGKSNGIPGFFSNLGKQIGSLLGVNGNSGNNGTFATGAAGNSMSKDTSEGMQKVAQEGKKSADDMANAMQGAMKRTEGVLTQFVETGKLSFKDLTKSILADIAQIMIKMAVSKLIGFVFGSFGGGAGAVASAAGGYDIPSGENPVTRLHEKEMVLPSRYANVIRGLANNGGTAVAGGGININTNISVASDGSSNQQNDGSGSSQRQLADMINSQTKAIIAREMRQGGLIWNMRMGVA